MNKNKLRQWFLENDITSISPPMALVLADILGELRPEIINVRDGELYEDLEAYKDALLIVCRTAAVHQKAVIDKLDVLVKGRER